MGKRQAMRWAARLAFLGAAVVLAVGGPVPLWLRRLFPSMSPLAAVCGSIAQRSWYLGLYWAGPPLILLALAVWRGRFFCRWVCPAGTLHSIPARVSLGKRFLRRPISGVIFWTVLFGSLVGAPLLICLDPLSTFNRLVLPLKGLTTAAWLVPGLMIPVFLVLGFIQPRIWCTHVCPLGYGLDLLLRLRTRRPRLRPIFSRTRREILAGAVLGVPMALLLKRFGLTRPAPAAPPILPPGARDPASFAALCSRCYGCVNVCPTGIIRLAGAADRALGQFFQPEIDFSRGICKEDCHACTRVCPTGAIALLTREQKRNRQIGLAVVNQETCVSWANDEACMQCETPCPYHAIMPDVNAWGIARPIVIEDACRGCGACEVACPVTPKAITVRGVKRQRTLSAPVVPAAAADGSMSGFEEASPSHLTA